VVHPKQAQRHPNQQTPKSEQTPRKRRRKLLLPVLPQFCRARRENFLPGSLARQFLEFARKFSILETRALPEFSGLVGLRRTAPAKK
jgi:hypothetical protein